MSVTVSCNSWRQRFPGHTLLAFLVSFALFHVNTVIVAATSSSSSPRFAQASFVPPASPPSATRSGPLPFFTPIVATTSLEGDIISGPTTTTKLQAKKKGGNTAQKSSKKIQVKLLKHVAGTGQAGEVVLVTPAFFNNKLRPTSSAAVISDEQVSLERQQQQALEKEILDGATTLRDELEQLEFLSMPWKAGPSGQLFGGIHPKNVLEAAQQQVPNDFWTHKIGSKSIKITQLWDEEKKKKMRGDIKHTGDYAATIALTRDISVKVAIRVLDQDNLSP